MSCCDTVVLSDLHLGSEVSRAKAALETLKGISFQRLILLGDIFCDLNFRRLKKEHWQFLGYIRKLSNPKRQTEVVWVEGNHDHGLSEVMSHLVGVQVYEEYKWEFCGIWHLAIHGHQFDRLVVSSLPLNNFLMHLYLQLQKLDFGRRRLVGCLERVDTAWLRLSAKVAKGALAYARTHDVGRIFCGHTHEAMQAESNGIEYYNSGSWTQERATFITIGAEGVHVHEYEERADDRDPSEERGEVDPAFADFADSAGLPGDAEYESVPG